MCVVGLFYSLLKCSVLDSSPRYTLHANNSGTIKRSLTTLLDLPLYVLYLLCQHVERPEIINGQGLVKYLVEVPILAVVLLQFALIKALPAPPAPEPRPDLVGCHILFQSLQRDGDSNNFRTGFLLGDELVQLGHCHDADSLSCFHFLAVSHLLPHHRDKYQLVRIHENVGL